MHTPNIHESAIVLPGARVTGQVSLGPEANVWYNAVIRGDMAPISIGARSNIQDGSVVHVDTNYPTTIGQDVIVGHACILHGCTIGDQALVGMGSIVLNGAVLEEGCVLGAGSLVTEGTVIPAGMLAFGRPAKVVRPVTLEEQAYQRQIVAHYVANALEHQNAQANT